MLTGLSDAELRNQCRARLEVLELWLRRLIDLQLKEAYGNYFEAKTSAGSNVIKRAIVEGADKRIAANPDRYHRRIDAILLDDAAAILCNPEIYKAHFAPCFIAYFPLGAEHVWWTMKRLVPIRNKLSHANAIGLREAETVFCFTGDLIAAIKSHYRDVGMEQEYNVPLISKVIDHWGNVFHRDQLRTTHSGEIVGMFSKDPKFFLRPGDILTLEVEIDPSFEVSTYDIRWGGVRKPVETIDKPKLVLPIEDYHVAQNLSVHCKIFTHRTWHRLHNGADDMMILSYRVLPPL